MVKKISMEEFKKMVKAQEPTIEPQQIYAKIKKSSKYAGQEVIAKRNGVYPFPVMIQGGLDDHIVKGGPGGQYRLKDLVLFIKANDKYIKIKG